MESRNDPEREAEGEDEGGGRRNSPHFEVESGPHFGGANLQIVRQREGACRGLEAPSVGSPTAPAEDEERLGQGPQARRRVTHFPGGEVGTPGSRVGKAEAEQGGERRGGPKEGKDDGLEGPMNMGAEEHHPGRRIRQKII